MWPYDMSPVDPNQWAGQKIASDYLTPQFQAKLASYGSGDQSAGANQAPWGGSFAGLQTGNQPPMPDASTNPYLTGTTGTTGTTTAPPAQAGYAATGQHYDLMGNPIGGGAPQYAPGPSFGIGGGAGGMYGAGSTPPMPAWYSGPSTYGNPWLDSMGNDIGRRLGQQFGQNMAQIGTHAVGVGGLGGSRQGVAQGLASQGASDAYGSALANLYGGQYNADANRGLQRYGIDTNAALGWGGLDNSRLTADQQFYSQQRAQDQSQIGLGAGLLQQGLNAGWTPIQHATNTYSPFTGFGTTTSGGQQGGGLLGGLGGALGAYQLGNAMGWFK